MINLHYHQKLILRSLKFSILNIKDANFKRITKDYFQTFMLIYSTNIKKVDLKFK